MDSDQQQQFCLKWNSFGNNLATSFSNLFKSESLTDVTLFCEGKSSCCAGKHIFHLLARVRTFAAEACESTRSRDVRTIPRAETREYKRRRRNDSTIHARPGEHKRSKHELSTSRYTRLLESYCLRAIIETEDKVRNLADLFGTLTPPDSLVRAEDRCVAIECKRDAIRPLPPSLPLS